MKMITQCELNYISSRNDKELIFGNFLDEFYRCSDEARQSMVEVEPVKDEKIRGYLCMVAAAVERLCHIYHLNIPAWVDEPWYFAPKKVYALNTENKEFQKYLEETSYFEYKRHNVFYGDDVLERR